MNLFELFISEITREIRLFATADITLYIIVLAMFMWVWKLVNRLMRLR